MSTTSQPTTFSDLFTDLQNRVRVTTGISATETQAKRYINIGLQDMHLGTTERFRWAERSGVILTHPTYSTGTLSVTQGSTTVTGVGTLWNTANAFGDNNARAGGKIQIAGTAEAYEVASVAGDTSLTLTSRYVGSTVTDGTYLYYEDEYSLPSDFLRPLDFHKFSDDINIDLVSRVEFRRIFGRNITRGMPKLGCILSKPPSGNTSPVNKIQFNKAPDQVYMVKFWYYTSNLVVTNAGAAQVGFVNNDDEPILPLGYRHLIVLHALYNWYRDKKDDQRSQEVKAEYTDAMLRLLAGTEVGDTRASIRPRLGKYFRRAASPYGGNRRRFDTGGRFDTLEDVK